MLGKDIIKHKDNIDLIPDFLELIDPEGANVIQEKTRINGGYLCVCQFKFLDSMTPFEAVLVLPNKVFSNIVMRINIESLMKGIN
jgi:hypothetical protein